jgi:hypothetical protein
VSVMGVDRPWDWEAEPAVHLVNVEERRGGVVAVPRWVGEPTGLLPVCAPQDGREGPSSARRGVRRRVPRGSSPRRAWGP